MEEPPKKSLKFRSFRELEEQYRLLRDFMDHTPDVIYFKDRKGRLLLVNQAHAKGLGLKPDEVIGKTDFDIFGKERAELMARDDRKVMLSGKPIIDKVERATRPDGVDNYVSTTKFPRYDEQGRIIGLVGITRDITHRMQVKRLEEERAKINKKIEVLQEINKLETGFISAVSHELRTPLAIIKEAIALVSEGLAGPLSDKQKELLIRANNNIGRLRGLIDDLLDISRIETGKLKLHYSLVNLKDLIVDSADHFKRLAQGKGIKLQYLLPKKETSIFVDAERTIQIINNLIDNAIKYTEEKGEIKIRVDILDDRFRVGVFDSGVGITRQDLPKLFNKFTQVSKVAGAEKKGIGLGLSIVKELVQKHGGEIWVESRSGVGSKFYFTLPRLHDVSVISKDLREKVNALLNQGKKIYLINLLVMNSPEIKKIIKIKAGKLAGDLKILITEAFKDAGVDKGDGFQINLADAKKAEFTVIFPDTTDKKVSQGCEALKGKIANYFKRNKVRNVFVNIGRLPYLNREEGMANFQVNNVRVGLEKRYFNRVGYSRQMEVNLRGQSNSRLSVQAVDISRGGACFFSDKQLETDSQIEVRLILPTARRPLSFKARVAWIKPASGPRAKKNKYKIGARFFKIKSESRKGLARFIELIAGSKSEG